MYSSSIFCATQSTAELHHVSLHPSTHCPRDHLPQHNQPIRNNITNTHPDRRPSIFRHNELHHHDHNTAREPARQQREAQEQHQPRLPRNTVPAVAEAVGAESRLVDRVDDEHAERRAHARDPIDEGDVHGRVGGVLDRFGPYCDVDEGVEAEGELRHVYKHWNCDMRMVQMPTRAPAA